MNISVGVAMLELKVQNFILNPTLVWDEEMAILIDTGMPGQMEQIRIAMAEVGVAFDKLKTIILTHQDLDHIAGLPDIQNQSTQKIEVLSHNLDKPYIEGELPLIKTNPSRMTKEAWDTVPEQLKPLYENPPKSKINKTLEDGEELPYCGGIRVISTPGHTPGHISLYLKQSKTLVAGDAMVCVNGQLRGPIPQTTLDMKAAMQSLSKFQNFDIQSVICYHGGLCNTNVDEQIRNLTVLM